MKISRAFAIPAVAAAAVLTMTGCFQLPSPAAPTASSPTATGSDEAGADIAGTTWVGSTDVQGDLAFTLNADGTVDFTTWGTQSFDSPADVWSGDESSLTMTVTQIVEQGSSAPPLDITYTGAISGGSMNLTGQGTDGNSYSLQATQG